MIVVDNNALTYLWLPGKNKSLVRRVAQKDSEWGVPILWKSEFKSVLIQFFRNDLIDRADVYTTMQIVSRRLKPTTFAISDIAVLDLAAGSKCSTYDCEYVALAIKLDVTLVTNDKQVLREFPGIAMSPKDFIAS